MILRYKKPIIFATLLVLNLVGCSFSNKVEKQQVSGLIMGTSYEVLLFSTEKQRVALQRGIQQQLQQVNDLMSTYIEDSELNQFNRFPIGQSMALSNKTFEVMNSAWQISTLTQGAFDATVAPLVDLWGFGPQARPENIPDLETIEQWRTLVDFKGIRLDPKNKTATKLAYRQLDLSAIAKGYAVDQLAQYLTSQQITRFLINIGGEMRASGLKEAQKPWVIAITQPNESGEISAFSGLKLNIGQQALATSGDYYNYYERGGVRYSHTIDPRTGFPIDHTLASVSIIAEQCANADALATALSVMGPEQALAFANKHNIAAYFIIRDDGVFVGRFSQEFKQYMVQ